jgi:2-polyprenyl-3-methyl-5-hydroxy-6-metoxy-1,4-benzoquinol methylase
MGINMEALALGTNEPKENSSDINWTNADNKLFYENLSFDDYQKYLSLAGLTNNPDIELIKDYILSASSILEVGPGYGRVIEAAKNIGYQNKFTAIEFSHSLANNLKDKYKDDVIIEESFLESTCQIKFDLILMMWTTLSVFNPINEQQACFYQCAKMMEDNGYCVIDLLLSNSADKAILHTASETYITNAENNTTHYGYGPSILELIRYAATAGLAVRQIKEYRAATAERCLVILGKS